MILIYLKSWWNFFTGRYNRNADLLAYYKKYENELADHQKRLNKIVGKFNSRPKRAKKRKV